MSMTLAVVKETCLGLVDREDSSTIRVCEVLAQVVVTHMPLPNTRTFMQQIHNLHGHNIKVVDTDAHVAYTRPGISPHKILCALWQDLRQCPNKGGTDSTIEAIKLMEEVVDHFVDESLYVVIVSDQANQSVAQQSN